MGARAAWGASAQLQREDGPVQGPFRIQLIRVQLMRFDEAVARARLRLAHQAARTTKAVYPGGKISTVAAAAITMRRMMPRMWAAA